MKRTVARILMTIALGLSALGAHAAITCTISSSSWSTAYVPTTPTTNVTQSTFSLTCQRNVNATDPTSLSYFVAVDNGLNVSGQQNRARLGATASYILYENYRDSACTLIWKGAGGNRITGTMTLSGLTPTTVTTSYWGCVPGSQTGLAAGAYTDTVTMTVTNSTGGATLATNTIGVTIFNPAVCNITQTPAVSFTYTAFQTSAQPSNAGMPQLGVTCTNLLPYSMALDATSGVVGGLQYTLSLPTASATGNGSQQNYTISGTMPALQAGCATPATCPTTDTRTITITY